MDFGIVMDFLEYRLPRRLSFLANLGHQGGAVENSDDARATGDAEGGTRTAGGEKGSGTFSTVSPPAKAAAKGKVVELDLPQLFLGVLAGNQEAAQALRQEGYEILFVLQLLELALFLHALLYC